MKTHVRNHQAGFTLLEYIVSLVIAAIVASMVYTFFGSALTQSSTPITRLKQASNLYRVMENIVSDYNRLNAVNLRAPWKATSNYNIGEIVVPNVNNGYYYKCTTAGQSGATQPNWGTLTNNISDGSVVWKRSDYNNTPYANVYVWKEGTTYNAGDIVLPTFRRSNGHYYRCITAGTSDAASDNQPNWPTTYNQTVNETSPSTLVWQEIGTILEVDSAYTIENMSTKLASAMANYGSGFTSWSVQESVFVSFNSATPREETTATERSILKVTIRNTDTSEILREYFTIR